MLIATITVIAFLSNLISSDLIILWAFWGGIFGLVSGLVGAKRYIGGAAGFFLGFFLGPLGLEIVLCSNKKEPDFVFSAGVDSTPDQLKKYKHF